MLPLTLFVLWAYVLRSIIFPTHYLSPQFFFFCALAVYLMHSSIRLHMSVGSFLAWAWFFSVLRMVVPPNMPWSWYMFWVAAIPAGWVVIHPEISALRFFGWTASLFVGRFVVYLFYVWYWLNPSKSNLFPFNLVSGWCKASNPRWIPTADAGFCCRCKGFISGSSLITGSRFPVVRLVERHKHHESVTKLRSSAASCRVCNLLLDSMSDDRRQRLMESPAGGPLAVRVWEERPLSLYTYVQLFQGGDAIGARLLVHRGPLFQEASDASESSSTDSDNHIKLAKNWISMCKENHPHCNGAAGSSRQLPTRLLRIEPLPDGKITIQLEEMDAAAADNENIEYLAFSHCWGLPKMKSKPFTLLTENYDTCKKGISVSKLCQNMQDAVAITHRLGHRYMWIDSLCIIQNSTADWKTESRKMANVYSGAACTVASTASDSGDGGCFHERDDLAIARIKIGTNRSGSESIYIRCDDVFDFERYIDRAPLNRRGWVFQERLLSRRILHFGARMMYWECRQRSATEINPQGYVYKKYPDDFRDHYAPKLTGIYTRDQLEDAEREARGVSWSGKEGISRRPPPPVGDPDDETDQTVPWLDRRRLWKDIRKRSSEDWEHDRTENLNSGFRAAFDSILAGNVSLSNTVGTASFSYNWYEIVETYTRGELSQASDKLVAMSAITHEVQKATGYTFVAGLWKETILTDLLWFVAPGGKGGGRLMIAHSPSSSEVSQFPVCPTWSWASLQATVSIDLVPDNSTEGLRVKSPLAEVLSLSARPVSPEGDSSSAPQHGVLVVRGPLCRVSKKELRGKVWQIWARDEESVSSRQATTAWFFPDLTPEVEGADDDGSNLFCMPILELERSPNQEFSWGIRSEVRGLVLRQTDTPIVDTVGQSSMAFERVGLFTTTKMKLGTKAREVFLGAKKVTAEIS